GVRDVSERRLEVELTAREVHVVVAERLFTQERDERGQELFVELAHRALRLARGAARVDDDRALFGGRVERRRVRSIVEQLLERKIARRVAADGEERVGMDRLQLRLRLVDRRRERRVEDER